MWSFIALSVSSIITGIIGGVVASHIEIVRREGIDPAIYSARFQLDHPLLFKIFPWIGYYTVRLRVRVENTQ